MGEQLRLDLVFGGVSGNLDNLLCGHNFHQLTCHCHVPCNYTILTSFEPFFCFTYIENEHENLNAEGKGTSSIIEHFLCKIKRNMMLK